MTPTKGNLIKAKKNKPIKESGHPKIHNPQDKRGLSSYISNSYDLIAPNVNKDNTT